MISTSLLALDSIGWVGASVNVLLLALLVVFSAIFSGSEAVLFSLTPGQLGRLRKSTNPFRRLAATVMDRSGRTLMTILVANTAVNVLLFSSSYVFFRTLGERFGDWVSPVSGVFSVLIVVVFGEVAPKIVGVSLAERLAPFAALTVRVASIPCGPVGRLIDWLLVIPVNRVLFGETSAVETSPHELTADELKTLLDINRRQGVLNADETLMLREVIDLGHTRVREIMTPRVEMAAYDVNESREGLIKLMRETKLKKIPLYEGGVDNIIGLIYAKVLFFNADRPLRELVAPVRFVPELISCEQALRHFRTTRSQLAIAVDEFGGVAGIVALEDVLEEIVGDIQNPDDEPEHAEIVRVGEHEYEISGALGVQAWAETFGVRRPEERVATVGGLVAARLGRTPHEGDVVSVDGFELRVLTVARHRAVRLHLHVPQTKGGGA